ncbi:MAG: hypothetical protein WDZ28_00255 [Simkaniaceae bacterium]
MDIKSHFSFVKSASFFQKFPGLSLLILVGVWLFFLSLFSVSLVSKRKDLDEMNQQFSMLKYRFEKTASDQRKKRQFIHRYQGHRAYFLEEVLEKMLFLTPEIRALEGIENHPSFQNWSEMRNRLNFLKSSQNQLRFSELKRIQDSSIEEVEASLMHSVELDSQDLKKLLSYIERIQIGDFSPLPDSPQLTFKRFNLERNKTFSSKEVYKLNFEIIKRELK